MTASIRSYYEEHQLERFMPKDALKHLQIHSFAKGREIYALEEPIHDLYFFVEGRAKVFLPTEQGKHLLLCFYEPLQLFGDLELFEATPQASTTIQAVQPCICLGLPRSYVIEELAQSPVFLQQICMSLGKKLNRVITNSALNLLHPLENRIASYMLATAHQERDNWIFSANLNHTAESLGSSFRHLHRTLQRLVDRSLIQKIDERRYLLLDRKELEQIAGGIYIQGS